MIAHSNSALFQDAVGSDDSDGAGTETILVVEDEAPVRRLLCLVLRDKGYTVLEAQNGEDAMAKAEAHSAPINLVISDVIMPDMDGRVLSEHLRQWNPQMRILFISGYARGALGDEHFKGSPTAFLGKPFEMHSLVSEVRQLLDASHVQAARMPMAS